MLTETRQLDWFSRLLVLGCFAWDWLQMRSQIMDAIVSQTVWSDLLYLVCPHPKISLVESHTRNTKSWHFLSKIFTRVLWGITELFAWKNVWKQAQFWAQSAIYRHNSITRTVLTCSPSNNIILTFMNSLTKPITNVYVLKLSVEWLCWCWCRVLLNSVLSFDLLSPDGQNGVLNSLS
jgi:hypothetical protein